METTRMVARRSHIRLSGVMVHRGDEFDATPREVEEYARLSHLAEPTDVAPAESDPDGEPGEQNDGAGEASAPVVGEAGDTSEPSTQDAGDAASETPAPVTGEAETTGEKPATRGRKK